MNTKIMIYLWNQFSTYFSSCSLPNVYQKKKSGVLPVMGIETNSYTEGNKH